MSKLDSYLTDNSAKEDADYAEERGQERIFDHINDLDHADLFKLAIEVLGADGIADAILDTLEGKSVEEINETLRRAGVSQLSDYYED
jgi:hypothetical protein